MIKHDHDGCQRGHCKEQENVETVLVRQSTTCGINGHTSKFELVILLLKKIMLIKVVMRSNLGYVLSSLVVLEDILLFYISLYLINITLITLLAVLLLYSLFYN